MTIQTKTRNALLALALLTGATRSMAGELAVHVVDREGRPVPDVAVFVRELDVERSSEARGAVMDQRDGQFVPHLLVVERGAAVEFPNSDIVAHHVYSFSRPNDFVLPLYKGVPPEPIVFEQDGIVTLGCNIHDGMLAYIVVVDTPVFGTTDEHGRLSVAVDDSASSYEVRIWSPRIRDATNSLLIALPRVPDDDVVFKLRKSLRLAHTGQSESVEWEEY